MIQILITMIAAAIIMPLAYFQFKETALPKRMLIAGSIVGAAILSAFLQILDFAFYVPLLAIVAISMLGAIVYTKVDEKEKEEKLRIAEERRQNQQSATTVQQGSPAMSEQIVALKETVPAQDPAKSLYDEPAPEKKSFAMQTIGVAGEEQ